MAIRPPIVGVRMIVVCSQLKNLSVSFVICASCMLYVRFTVVCREPPPQYPLNIIYTFLPHCFASIGKVGGWYRLSSCVGHIRFFVHMMWSFAFEKVPWYDFQQPTRAYPRHINLYILYISSTMMVVDCSS